METAMWMIAAILVALVALEHVYILVLEMFLWTTPRALKTFGTKLDFAVASKGLAANQGLYNGFLAAGLVWSLMHGNAIFAFQLKLFFLGCVLVAALYGAWSVRPRIFLVQGLPALLALLAVLFFANPYGAGGSVTVATLQSFLNVF
jgi:putative membrane protein